MIKLSLIDKGAVAELKNYLAKGKFTNTKEYKRMLFMLPSPISENSLQEFNSALSKEWYPTKNGNLTPKDVTPFSNKKVWWKCANSHEG